MRVGRRGRGAFWFAFWVERNADRLVQTKQEMETLVQENATKDVEVNILDKDVETKVPQRL
jgi:hypothetical protein